MKNKAKLLIINKYIKKQNPTKLTAAQIKNSWNGNN